jgi:hypothetical protein
MDGKRFDTLTRQLSSRRVAIGGLLAGLLVPLEAAARKKDKHHKRTGKAKAKKLASAQQEPCWRAGECLVSKGSNVSQCDLAGYTAPDPLDCTRCNLSRANLRGADLTGVNFTRANLSGACLVDADFTGATFANSTNLYNAIFCRTTMPDGSVNNSGCASGTACCPTCNRGLGMTCSLAGDICCAGTVCQNGTCVCVPNCAGKCGGASDGCGGTCNAPCDGTCSQGQCVCSDLHGSCQTQAGCCSPNVICAAGRCCLPPGANCGSLCTFGACCNGFSGVHCL